MCVCVSVWFEFGRRKRRHVSCRRLFKGFQGGDFQHEEEEEREEDEPEDRLIDRSIDSTDKTCECVCVEIGKRVKDDTKVNER